jgi:hypothetical protein
LGFSGFLLPDGGWVDNDTIVICCCPIIHRRNTCIYQVDIGIWGGYLPCFIFYAIMALSIILWLGGISGFYVLYIFLHHIKILNGCEKLMYNHWTSVDYFS